MNGDGQGDTGVAWGLAAVALKAAGDLDGDGFDDVDAVDQEPPLAQSDTMYVLRGGRRGLVAPAR